MNNVLSLSNDGDYDDYEYDEDQLEVSRHGIAILFDLLRFDTTSSGIGIGSNSTCSDNNYKDQIALNVLNARKIALNAGLHNVLNMSMKKFPNDTQIMMMGKQILLATSY